VEGWLQNTTIVGAHIEILPNKSPIVCAAWQQIIAPDNVSYIGAGPLMISPKALKNLIRELNKLAMALKSKGAVGSFGPDFLITSAKEKNFDPDTAVLLELNARIPYTALPLEAIKHIKGKIGSGFCITHITVKKTITFVQIANALSEKGLLITKRGPHAKGVIPFNIGMLPWKTFNIMVLADTWEETKKILTKVNKMFS
jgi:hypothetical protein